VTRAALARALACVLLGVCLGACRDAEPLTQIVVQLDSDWDGFRQADVEIRGFVKPATVHVDATEKDAFPRRITLVHDGGPLGPIAVTVRATEKGADEPSLIEPRTDIFFVRDQTRLLKIDLLFDCIGKCAAGKACVPGTKEGAGPRCVTSTDAAKLVPWDDDVRGLDPSHFGDVRDDGDSSRADAGDGGEDGMDAGDAQSAKGDAGDADVDEPDADAGGHPTNPRDAEADTGVPSKVTKFDEYEPSNVDPESDDVTDLDLVPVALDCGISKFDSSTLKFSDWCGDEPSVMKLAQPDGPEAALIVMSSLSVAAESTLALSGNRPVIFLVYGDAHVAGTIDVSAHGTAGGAGAYDACGASLGGSGEEADSVAGVLQGAGGGAGGGFGSAGGLGGADGASSAKATAGAIGGESTLRPLRGGCAGGPGGEGDEAGVAAGGGGGGAIQISAAGVLDVTGTINAGGGGGAILSVNYSGGGGGGSGGAILLEGTTIEIDDAARIGANGGGGGGGQRGSGTPASVAGSDAHADGVVAGGGSSTGSGGDGGAGATAALEASSGSMGTLLLSHYGGGGGGGGGVGRIRINQAKSCGPSGGYSPAPSVGCPTCGECPLPPALGCARATHAGVLYYLCGAEQTWTTAQANCKSVGMDLVHVDSADENTWLAGAIADESWIGANDTAAEGDWCWSDDGAAFWSGDETGAAVGGAFNGWTSSEPNDSSSGFAADCASIAGDATWSDRQCTSSYPYVCE
jgi:hypothetical protein